MVVEYFLFVRGVPRSSEHAEALSVRECSSRVLFFVLRKDQPQNLRLRHAELCEQAPPLRFFVQSRGQLWVGENHRHLGRKRSLVPRVPRRPFREEQHVSREEQHQKRHRDQGVLQEKHVLREDGKQAENSHQIQLPLQLGQEEGDQDELQLQENYNCYRYRQPPFPRMKFATVKSDTVEDVVGGALVVDNGPMLMCDDVLVLVGFYRTVEGVTAQLLRTATVAPGVRNYNKERRSCHSG
mmetsp:Transcript_2752/g.6395  ORF Transcript_2752/g.6395 Transcript_2752/m.6395 type:complete len:240 (-) Transcript_2752:188-907(-)